MHAVVISTGPELLKWKQEIWRKRLGKCSTTFLCTGECQRFLFTMYFVAMSNVAITDISVDFLNTVAKPGKSALHSKGSSSADVHQGDCSKGSQ